MKKYVYQKFLLQCDYDTVDIDGIPGFSESIDDIYTVGVDYNLFDVGRKVVRKLSLEDLDVRIDTIEDWRSFVTSLQGIDELIIYDSVPHSSNRIIEAYRQATLKAYVYRMGKDCQTVKLYYNDTV